MVSSRVAETGTLVLHNGFKQSLADPCMYVKHDGKDIVIC